MQEREPVGVLIGFDRSFMHQTANSEVSQHEAVEFLANQVRGLAAQDGLGAAQMSLEFVERGFDFPALMIERRQLRGGSFGVIENGGDEPVDRLGVGDAI